MAEVQLLGMTHFPPFGWSDEHMGDLMTAVLADPGVPPEQRDPARWPPAQRAEWADDRGASAAATHREALVAGLDRVREELERFAPDVLLVWGDDQYENFRKDLIPPYAILAYPDRVVHPYRSRVWQMAPSYWDEPDDLAVTVRGRPDIARWLVERLSEVEAFEVPYAYEPLHDEQLPHAFLNTVMFLDHRRIGFDWPMICMPINCYGRKVVSAKGTWRPFGARLVADPPSPLPSRLMDLGGAVMRQLLSSPWRVSLIASASWSHSFLTDHQWRLRPDTVADRRLYEAMREGRFDTWSSLTTNDVEHAGQQEVLNWCALMGAAREAHAVPSWSTFVETWCFNSNKVFAAWEPVPARVA